MSTGFDLGAVARMIGEWHPKIVGNTATVRLLGRLGNVGLRLSGDNRSRGALFER